MTDALYTNQLAVLAAYGPPEQRERARAALQQLASDQETDADPAEDLGVQNNATQEQLHAVGVPYHGSVLLMELDAARVDQDEHNTLDVVKKSQRLRTCPHRLLFLRDTLLKACREQQPLHPWFYHALLTLAYIRRNTRVLRRTRATRSLPPTPASSADQEDATCYDDYDLLDELRECSCCVKNVWDQLMLFLERMRMREFELQPLDEQERKWCNEHDSELRQIFLYLRGELCATNPVEYRAVWELLQTGNLDLAEMRRLWRGVQPHVLSRKRAAMLLKLVAAGHLNQSGLAYTLHKELAAVKSSVEQALRVIRLNTWERDERNVEQNDLQHFAELFEDPKRLVSDTAAASQIEELYAPVHTALQTLWTTCVRERIAGNQTKPLELVLRHCMVDRDAVLKLVRDCNISLRITEAIRLRWQTAVELTTTYVGSWVCIQDLEDVRPRVGARELAFALWCIIRQSDKFQVVKTAVSQNANSPLFANAEEAIERSFLAMRCFARHSMVMNLIADAYVGQSIEGQWELVDMNGIKRGQDYVRCIMAHEAWFEKYEKPISEPPEETQLVAPNNNTKKLRDVPQTQRDRRLKKIENDPVALEVYNMTDENRMETKIRWLVFATFIVPRKDLQKVLTRAHYTRWAELFEAYCEEHSRKPDARSGLDPNVATAVGATV